MKEGSKEGRKKGRNNTSIANHTKPTKQIKQEANKSGNIV
jgi:hypothetical protein